MNPNFLENLYTRLGRPVWFWPLVMFAMFVLFVLGSSVAGPELDA